MRRLSAIALALGLLLAGAGHAGETPVYTNLADKKSREDIRLLLHDAGIPAPEADGFLDGVQRTADAFGNMGLAGAKWRPLDEGLGDPYAFQDAWEKEYPDFIGYNCRITAFSLLKSRIAVREKAAGPSPLLAFDIAAVHGAPAPLFTENETIAFQTLFAPIPAAQTTDASAHGKEIQAYYQKQGVCFSKGPKLVTVYIHGEDLDNPGRYCLFPGHAGVLIEQEGGLYFVEKLAFQMPYRVTRFGDKAQLVRYLKTSYASFRTEGLSELILMEDGQPLL